MKTLLTTPITERKNLFRDKVRTFRSGEFASASEEIVKVTTLGNGTVKMEWRYDAVETFANGAEGGDEDSDAITLFVSKETPPANRDRLIFAIDAATIVA